MLEHTDTDWGPWVVADFNSKRVGRLNVVRHLLDQVPYEDLTPAPLRLPDRQAQGDYEPPDWSGRRIPDVYSDD